MPQIISFVGEAFSMKDAVQRATDQANAWMAQNAAKKIQALPPASLAYTIMKKRGPSQTEHVVKFSHTLSFLYEEGEAQPCTE